MDFTILYGRAGCGKTHRCVEKIKEYIASGEKCIMIIPEQFSYRTEKLLTGALGATSSETAEAVTFTRLAGRILMRQSGASKLPVSAAGKNMLTYRALTSVRKSLSTYALAAEKVGFADKAASLISEFKRYGISPQDVARLGENAQGRVLSAKLSDLALIYSSYDELFLSDYSDFEDNLYVAAEVLEQSDYLCGIHIFIDEFTDFLPQHYKMLEALCTRAASVTVCLCANKQLGTQGVFAPASRTFFKLKNMCRRSAKVNFRQEYLGENMLHRGNGELLYLERGYENIGCAPYTEKTENIRIFEALNVYSEIENAAREIQRIVRDKNARWRDIAVCCGDADMYFEPVKIIFERYGIPCFLAEKRAVSSHPLILTLLSALDILISGYSYEAMFSYLKTGFANVNAYETDILENYVLATGAGRKAWLDEKPWSYKSDLSDGQAQINDEIDEIRRRVTAPLARLRENIGSKHTVSHACEAVYRFVCELGMDEKTQKLTDEFRASGDLVSANRYSRIWNGIMNILDQAVLIAGDKKLGMQQFKNLLETGFMKEQMGIIPQAADAVSVLDVPNMRASQCEYMFALGTNTGGFMGTAPSEGILTDRERETIGSMGTELAPTVRASLFDARFAIYKAVTRPRRRLYLSYAISGMSGEAMAESEVCSNIRGLFPAAVISDDLTERKNDVSLLADPKATFGELALHMDGMGGGEELWRSVYDWYESHEEYRERLGVLKNALSYKTAAQRLSMRQTQMLYPHGINTSVSRLERYSRCPFSYFIEYTLKAKERKILKIGAPDIGSIMHAVLERFTKLIEHEHINWKQIDEEYIQSAISAIMDDLGEKIFRGSALDGKSSRYVMLRLKRNLIRCAKLLVMHIASGNFEPAGSEVRFGDDGEIEAVVMDLSSGKKLKIRGMIDRIDKCEMPDGTYYRVIDYKSGRKSFSLENVYNALDLQLVVYLEAAMQNDKKAKPAGMLYFHIHEPMKRTETRLTQQEAEDEYNKMMKLDGLLLNDEEVLRSMDKTLNSGFLPVSMTKSGEIRITKSLATMSRFEVLFRYVKSELKKIGDSISSGKIDIMPCRSGGASPCSYCAYKCVCKFDVTKDNNSYRECRSAGNDEVWEMMNGRE